MKRSRLRSEHQIFVTALLGALPGAIVAVVLLWSADLAADVRWGLGTVIVLVAVGCAAAARRRFTRPMQTLANMLAAMRVGDFSMRVRGRSPEDPEGLAFFEANRLADRLRDERLGGVEAGALLRAVLAEIEVAIIAVDDGARIQFVNRSGQALLGRKLAELVGAHAAEVGIADLLEGGSPVTIERDFPGGRGRWHLRRGSFRQEGRPHRLLVLADVSRALRAEEREAWRRLVRVLSHEINNSLAPIKSIAGSLLDLMRHEPAPADRDTDLEQGLRVIANRSEALGRFMTAYARLTRLPPPRRERVEVAPWVRRIANLETRTRVHLHEGEHAAVLADPDQLDQALINLVRNAAEASQETGGDIHVGWDARDGRVEVWVRDEGPGIASTDNLFVPFFTTKPGGSGIGLALSRQIVEAHEGAVTLRNREDGPGCEARVVLERLT